jgi:hypothetical protein
LPAQALSVVRNDAGTTTITSVDRSLQALVRSNAEALLARNIVVCEGRTDIGLSLGLSNYWAAQHNGRPVTHTGTAFADGGGATVGLRAEQLAALGYRVAVLADSDAAFSPGEHELAANGIAVFLWPGACCTEQRIALDIPLNLLQLALALASNNLSKESITDAVLAHLPPGSDKTLFTGSITEAIAAGLSEAHIRDAIGRAAHKGKWFKDISRGHTLGRLLVNGLSLIPQSGLTTTIDALGTWIYAQ